MRQTDPPPPGFTASERRLIARLRTPLDVQRYLNRLPYNTEPPPGGATLRSFRGVVRAGCANCLEAALFAATVLEQHGYPPLVLSFESIDALDHVIFVYQRAGRWGSVARSRDPGLHGRRAVFATPRALALSYVDPYVDFTGSRHRLRRRRSARDGPLRLASVRHQRLESGAHAARLPASPDQDVGRASQTASRPLSRLPRGQQRQKAD